MKSNRTTCYGAPHP